MTMSLLLQMSRKVELLVMQPVLSVEKRAEQISDSREK